MTSVPHGIPGGRRRRIEIVGMIVVGRHPDDPNRPADGWMARLSRAMGMSHSVVSSTMMRSRDDAFDRRFRIFLEERRKLMRDDIDVLAEIEAIVAHTVHGGEMPGEEE